MGMEGATRNPAHKHWNQLTGLDSHSHQRHRSSRWAIFAVVQNSDQRTCGFSRRRGGITLASDHFFLNKHDIQHIRGRPFHPMTQGKIERYHRSLRIVICLQNRYFPWQLEQVIAAFVDPYNGQRYREALNDVAPADVYCGRSAQILSQRAALKRCTLAHLL